MLYNIIQSAMFNKLMQIIEGEDQQDCYFYKLRAIRFDIDTDEEVRPFQKYLAVSYNVQDSKGNPGSIGNMFLTNLRIIWQMKSDISINLYFGLDSIVSMDVKTLPVQWGNGFKHNLTVKAQNLSQTRYEFKFAGYQNQQLKVFNKMIQMFRKVSNSKSFRCTNLAVKFDNDYEPMDGEELKITYDNITFIEDYNRYQSKIFVTNARLVIVKQNQKVMNYGITWLMIKSVEYTTDEDQDIKGIRLVCRGLLAPKVLILMCKRDADNKKLSHQLRSFCETYNRAPILGYTYDEDQKIQTQPKQKKNKVEDIEEFEGTKVNIVRRKKAYMGVEGTGNIANTQFNSQLGLMMQKLPEGVTRANLWEILRQK